MQRKYIYAIVIWLTIILVATEHYFNFNDKNSVASEVQEKYEESSEEVQKNIDSNSSLTIKNTQNDNKKISYIYKIKIDGVAGAKKASLNNKEKYIVFTANGEIQLVLNSNESITIYDLPDYAEYSVEQINELEDYYITKVNNEETRIITGKTTYDANISFNNTPNVVETPIEEIPIDEKIPAKEEIKEEEPKNEEQKNPVTADFVNIIIVSSVILLTLLIILKNIKVRRFE